MTATGLAHLVIPAPFIRVMPDYLPAHAALVFLSGVAEIAGGIGLLIPKLRQTAGRGLVILLVAVFPANIDMALHPPAGIPVWALWLRLPLQIPLILWAVKAGGIRQPTRPGR
jgi:uncharacterized membrane protein